MRSRFRAIEYARFIKKVLPLPNFSRDDLARLANISTYESTLVLNTLVQDQKITVERSGIINHYYVTQHGRKFLEAVTFITETRHKELRIRKCINPNCDSYFIAEKINRRTCYNPDCIKWMKNHKHYVKRVLNTMTNQVNLL